MTSVDLPDEIVTPRLRLRRFHADRSDVPSLLAILGDPWTMRFYPRPLDVEATTAWIERSLAAYEESGFGLYAVDDAATGELIGDCGPSIQHVDGEPFVELGWHVRRDRQRTGIAAEAGAAWRDVLLDGTYVDLLISLIRPENAPSWRVARKLGFRPWRGTVRAGMAHIVWRLDAPT